MQNELTKYLIALPMRDQTAETIARHFVDNDWGSRVRFPAEAGNFIFTTASRKKSGAHPASYPMGTRGSFLGVKLPGREADPSSLSSTEVKEWVELYLHSHNTPSCRGAQLKHRNNLILKLLRSCDLRVPTDLVIRLWSKFLKRYV
jgi:hypothetical protein